MSKIIIGFAAKANPLLLLSSALYSMHIEACSILIALLLSVLLVVLVVKSSKPVDSYISLPFGGGAIRTYGKNPQRIESPLWQTMSSLDDPSESNDYPI